MTIRRKAHEPLHPIRDPETEAELHALLEKVRAADYSGPVPAFPAGRVPAFPKVVKLGEDPAVDRMVEKLRAAKQARGNVMRTEGQDAAAGYVEPMPVPFGALPAVDTERRVKVNAPGVTVTEARARKAAEGPRDFAREKGEIWARMLEEHPDDPPGTVRIHPEAHVELLRLEEDERRVIGDGPLSMPDFSLPVPANATSKELEWERHRREQAREARELDELEEREEGDEPAPGSLSPMVTPRGTAAKGAGARRTLAMLAVGAAAAGVLVWRLVSAPQGPGQIAPAAGESAKTNPPAAAREHEAGKTNAGAQEDDAAAEPVPTNPTRKVDADAGAAVKPDVKEPGEKREPVSPPVPRENSSVAPAAAPGAVKAATPAKPATPAPKRNEAAPGNAEPQKQPVDDAPPEPTPPVKLPAAGSDPKF